MEEVRMAEKTKSEKVADRITQILIKLNNGDKLYIDRLAKEFGANERTIRRDLDRLGLILDIQEDGARVMSANYLGNFNGKDLRQFSDFMGVKDLFPSMDDSFFRAMLTTISNNAYMIKGHSHVDAKKSQPEMAALEKAIKNNQVVQFTYNNKERSSIKPYKLVSYKGAWYLAATENSELKTYSLEKIGCLRVTEEAFTACSEIERTIKGEDSIWFSQEKKQVTLHISKDVAYYFKRRQLLPNQEITQETQDGGLIVSSLVSDASQIIPLIKYWLPHVEVISPIEYKEQVLTDIKHYLEK